MIKIFKQLASSFRLTENRVHTVIDAARHSSDNLKGVKNRLDQLTREEEDPLATLIKGMRGEKPK